MKTKQIEQGKTYEVKSGKEARRVIQIGKDLSRPRWNSKPKAEPKPGATPIVRFEIIRGPHAGCIDSLYLFQFACWAHKEVAV
jgi:hypothetical protein